MGKIHELITNGNIEELQKLLTDKHAINELDEKGRTPLALALTQLIEARNYEKDTRNIFTMIQLLFEAKDIDLKVNSEKMLNLFAQAFYTEDFKLYEPFVKRIIKSSSATTDLFHAAIYAHNLNLVSFLLDQDKTLIKKKDKRGFSPYKICLAASATNIEKYFYEKFPSVAEEAKLDLKLNHPLPASVIIKAAISYENESLRKELEMIIDELYNDAAFRPTLDLIAASLIQPRSSEYKALRIFVANADNVQSLTPQSGAFGDLDRETIILRIGALRNRKELKGSIIHEFTHLAALLACANECKPFVADSKEQMLHEAAVVEMRKNQKSHMKFTETETKIGDLLSGRIMGYSSREETLKLPKGSLSIPEWIAGIPQAFVLYGEFYEDLTKSSIESFGFPMLSFWQVEFNKLVVEAFNNHSARKFIDTSVPCKEEQKQKIVLTTPASSLMTYINKYYRFDLNRNSDLVEGFNMGFPGQSSMAHQLLFGMVLDDALMRYRLPKELSLTDARRLLEHDLLSSEEYKNAFKDVYNAIAKAWVELGKPKDFSLENLKEFIEAIKSTCIPVSLQKDISLTVNTWAAEKEDRFVKISKFVDKVLKTTTEGYKIDKEDLTKLNQKMVDYLYLHLPYHDEVALEKLYNVLPKKLFGTIVKPAKKLPIFSSSTSNPELKVTSKNLDDFLQSTLKETFSSALLKKSGVF